MNTIFKSIIVTITCIFLSISFSNATRFSTLVVDDNGNIQNTNVTIIFPNSLNTKSLTGTISNATIFTLTLINGLNATNISTTGATVGTLLSVGSGGQVIYSQLTTNLSQFGDYLVGGDANSNLWISNTLSSKLVMQINIDEKGRTSVSFESNNPNQGGFTNYSFAGPGTGAFNGGTTFGANGLIGGRYNTAAYGLGSLSIGGGTSTNGSIALEDSGFGAFGNQSLSMWGATTTTTAGNGMAIGINTFSTTNYAWCFRLDDTINTLFQKISNNVPYSVLFYAPNGVFLWAPYVISTTSTTTTITNGNPAQAARGIWDLVLQLNNAATGAATFTITRPGIATNTLMPYPALVDTTLTNEWLFPVNPNTTNTVADVSGAGASVVVVSSKIEQ